MYVKQISVFLENTRGTLRQLTQLLGENGINLLAMAVADTSGFGIVRLIVKSDEVDKTLDILRRDGNVARVNDVVCIRIPNKPMGLAFVLSALESNGISIEYSYSFCSSTFTDAVIILRPSDKAACVETLKAAEVCMVSQEEVDRF